MKKTHHNSRFLSFILALMLILGSITVISSPVSAAELNQSYKAVSYQYYTGTTKPVSKSYWVTAKAKKTTKFYVYAQVDAAKLRTADAGFSASKAKQLLKFDVYLTEVKTGKTVQAHYYKSSGFSLTIPSGGKNYYVTVVSYFSNYKTAKNVNATLANSVSYYTTKK